MNGPHLIGAAGVGAVGLSRRFDPDVGLELGKIGRSGQWRNSHSCAALVAPLTTMIAAVDSAGVYKSIYVGAGAGRGWPIRAAPAVARGVGDEVGAGHRPSVGAEEILKFSCVAGLIDRGVKFVEAGRDEPVPVEHLVRVEKRFLQRRVVRRVVDKTVNRVQTCRRALDGGSEEVYSRLGVV